jgi:mannose/fructose/N-acetylgalactosamine-specific phosphotransferase system component IIB
MYAINQIIFLSAKVKKKVENSLINENLILKVVKNKIADEYFIYNKMIHYFQLKQFNSKTYFVTCGGNFKEQQVGNDKQFVFLTSIKIFEVSTLLDRNHTANNRNIDELMIKQINLLRNIEIVIYISVRTFPKMSKAYRTLSHLQLVETLQAVLLG